MFALTAWLMFGKTLKVKSQAASSAVMQRILSFVGFFTGAI